MSIFDYDEIAADDTVRVGFTTADPDEDPYSMPGDETENPYTGGVDEVELMTNSAVPHQPQALDIPAIVDSLYRKAI